MQLLKPGTLLQGGKYRIERMLGQGGFGITYQAIQVALNRRVAIKEFFMKEYCGRDADTPRVTVGTTGAAGIVSRFKEKFLKEASIIAQFDDPHIVRIHDIFEENGTAYYVMEFLEDRWNQFGKDGLPLELALNVVHQVGDALTYIHSKNVLHLDVKPSNILFRKDCAVLIDFGISKRYDAGGGQTSTTPVGISKGYAPLEQYNQGVQKFLPATDIYSLGATLYKLLTGQTPPEASDVMNYGLPTGVLQARNVPDNIIQAVKRSMDPRLVQRYQNVKSFMDVLGKTPERIKWNGGSSKPGVEETVVFMEAESKNFNYAQNSKNTLNHNELGPKPRTIWPYVAAISAFLVLCLGLLIFPEKEQASQPVQQPETTNTTTFSSSQTITANGVSFKMICVDGGTFTMGATSEQGSEADVDEKPAHQVTLSSFYIGETEVTQALWQAVMGSNPSNFKGANRPVETVSWEDCQTFISKLNSITEKTFRFPTEAEWEYAARGGNKSQGCKYSGSNTLEDVAWYWDNSGEETRDVKSKSPNELGLYDMSGNVWEWCQDWKGSYQSSSQTNPTGPSSGSNRVIRGGGWFNDAEYCRVSVRGNDTPGDRFLNLGLRLAM